jgi:Phage Tail Collar Domain
MGSRVLDFWQTMSADWARVTGAMMPYSGPIAPAGYIFANGVAQSRAAQPALLDALCPPFTGTTTSGSSIITNVSVNWAAELLVGYVISMPGIPNGATITAIAASSITVSSNATASASGVTGRVCPWGQGDNSTTFGIPDMRGEFPRGLDRGRGVDVNRKLGVAQGGTTISIAGNKVSAITGSDTTNGGTGGAFLSDDAGTTYVNHSVRLRNIAVNWIIKT